MPKVRGPLMSMTASGEFGNKSLIFSTRNGVTVCRKYAKPTGEPSAKQLQNRELMKTAAVLWDALSDYQRNKWLTGTYRDPGTGRTLPIKSTLTPRQRFIKQAMDLMLQGLPVYAQTSHLGTIVLPRKTGIRLLFSET